MNCILFQYSILYFLDSLDWWSITIYENIFSFTTAGACQFLFASTMKSHIV